MFARPPFLFGGCQIDLFEDTAFLFCVRSTTRFVSAEDFEALFAPDIPLAACEILDIVLNAEQVVDVAVSAMLGEPELGALPETDFPIGARPVGDLSLLAEARTDEALSAQQLVDLFLEGMPLTDCTLDALSLPVDVDLDARVEDPVLDAEITSSEDCL
ncbi:MAG: hypothetical protein V3T08_09710 [Gemmatimonadota bacterium]